MVDWAHLPEELSLLRAPAEKYGQYQMHSEILGFPEQQTPEMMQELRDLAKEISERRLQSKLMRWLEDHPITKDEAACLVYFLLGILDELDLKIAPVQRKQELTYDFFAEQWATKHYHGFLALAEVTSRSLPLAEGRQLAIQGLKRVPPQKLYRALLVLEMFPTEENVDWIERNICDPITEDWGRLAAISGIRWPQVVKWLDHGRPLNLVAIDALLSCYQYETEHLLKFMPKPKQPASRRVMSIRLRKAILEDPVPRVEKRVQEILANWDLVLGE